MPVVIGTSGWQYDDWKDVLYPGVPKVRWLEHFATVFPSVEVNNTFYNLPREKTFTDWAARTPDRFVFVLKASRYITHVRSLKDAAESVNLFLERARLLGEKLGAVLYQLPPTLRRNDELLWSFLEVVPPHPPTSVEFRHDSWYDDAVYSLMRARDVGLCMADGPKHKTPVRLTASWSYIRFHGVEGEGSYDDETLSAWAKRMAAMDADPIYCFFNNDRAGNAVKDALRLMRLVEGEGATVLRPAAAA